ncbi:MAG TPA: hypothetical protein ENN41_02875 [Sediminispirochaeta sp.]|nr:hypothetical protein [Sediminispirochaeta sp.]
MVSYYFNIGLIYFVIGFTIAMLTYFVFKKDVIGHFVGALIVGLFGSFLGGVLEYFFADIIELLSNLNNAVNIFPPIITSFVLMWLFVKASERGDTDE